MTYIDKDKALNLDFRINVNLFERRRKTAERAIQAYADAISSIPAADVRPVVLCKDCRHRDPEDGKCDAGAVERAGCVFPVGDNYFCAYGEKREES